MTIAELLHRVTVEHMVDNLSQATKFYPHRFGARVAIWW